MRVSKNVKKKKGLILAGRYIGRALILIWIIFIPKTPDVLFRLFL